MNDDRISEVYKGEIWTDAVQQRARRRIHWLCSQAVGDKVLDVGCSQGIVSILLGREGFTVIGIDIQPSRIEYARADLNAEPDAVQDRVSFEVTDGSVLEFEDDSFDTVILGEVIEHLAVPNRLLNEIRRVLKPGGVVAITTPFGLSPHHDHKQTFYPSRLWELISESLVIQSVDVVDDYFRIVAACTPSDMQESQPIDAPTADMLDDIWSAVDSELRTTRITVADLKKQRIVLEGQVDRQAEEITSLDRKLSEHVRSLASSVEELRSLRDRLSEREEHIAAQARKIVHQTEKIADQDAAIRGLKEEIADQDAAIQGLKGRLAESEGRVASQAEEVTDLKDRLSTSVRRAKAQQRRINHLEDDRAKLRDRLALARWKLASTTSRKWWRIGVAIGQVRSNVFRVFVLPFDIVSILFSHSNLPPRPQPTRVKKPAGAKGASPRVGITDSAAKAAQGSAAKHRDSKLLPMIVAAPASMSLAAPPVTNIRGLRVASILDEMSHQSFAPECDLVTFGPHNWLEVLERERPNILLVESAWRGNSGSWEYKVGTYAYAESVGLPDLTAVVEWCRREGVPTVFWNKEDPVHFEKFKEAAALFDVVFTTDENMVGRYQDLAGVADQVVGVLPFAAQPIIHNPVGTLRGRDSKPVFAGAYYRNRHHSRRSQLDMLLDAAMPFDLMIYDRMGGAISDSFGFPERFHPNIEGTLPYEEMVQAYRSHRLFLNVNSVSDSPTMFSRRVFELLASGTPVVSTSSVGVEQMFGGVVDIVETQSQANEAITRLIEDDEWWLDRSVRGVESVFQANTYADRLHTIAEAAGLRVGSARPRVSVVIGPSSDLSVQDLAGIDNVAEILSLTDQGSASNTGGVLPVRQIEAPSGGDTSSIGHAVSRAASGDWLAFANSAADLRALRSLTTATRITPAEIYVPASNWAQGHEFVNEFDVAGISVVSRDWVGRTSWSPWRTSNGSALGARVYAVPIIDD